MSLRLRLIISIGLALLASLTLGAALTVWHAGHKVQTEVRAAIAVGARVAQNAIDDSVRRGSNRRQRAERLIAEFDGDRHLRAFLVNRDNQVVLSSNPEPPKDIIPGWFQRFLGGDPQRAQLKLPTEFDDYRSVVLATDASNELAEAWSDITLALAVLATFCTFVLGGVYWTVARGLRPLQDLSVAFARIGRGDYSSSVAESGPIEFRRIAREFDQMVARLSTMKLQNDRLNEQLRTVQEEERASLARELHDEIGPFLFAVSLDAATLQQIAAHDLPLPFQLELAPRLDAIRDAVAHMQKHLKLILGRLRPVILLDLGLAHAIDNIIDFWKARYANIVFDVQVCREEFGERMAESIYLIVREALSNALRHGHPGRIEINIRQEINRIAISVTDDGGGMALTGSAIGFGITGMQERAAVLGGTLTVHNRADGKGVIVAAELPLAGSVESERHKEAFSA